MADAKKSGGYVATSADNILIVRPIMTEKWTAAREAHGRYAFEVAEGSSKPRIKEAVERMFGVTVRTVNVSRRPGKLRRVRTRAGFTKATKRAVVTLAADQKIAFFEGI